MSFAEKLSNVVNRHDEVQALLSNPDISADELVKLNKELAALTPVVEAVQELRRLERNMADDKAMMEDSSLDKEMREMAEAEYYELKERQPELEKQVKILLLPKEEDDEKMPFLKSGPVPAAMKRLCLRQFCLKCISAMRSCRVGNLKLWMPMKTSSAAIRRLRPALPAKMFSPNSSLNPALTAYSACR